MNQFDLAVIKKCRETRVKQLIMEDRRLGVVGRSKSTTNNILQRQHVNTFDIGAMESSQGTKLRYFEKASELPKAMADYFGLGELGGGGNGGGGGGNGGGGNGGGGGGNGGNGGNGGGGGNNYGAEGGDDGGGAPGAGPSIPRTEMARSQSYLIPNMSQANSPLNVLWRPNILKLSQSQFSRLGANKMLNFLLSYVYNNNIERLHVDVMNLVPDDNESDISLGRSEEYYRNKIDRFFAEKMGSLADQEFQYIQQRRGDEFAVDNVMDEMVDVLVDEVPTQTQADGTPARRSERLAEVAIAQTQARRTYTQEDIFGGLP